MSTRMFQNNGLDYRIQSLHVGMQAAGSSVNGEQKKCWHMLGKKFDWFQTGRNMCNIGQHDVEMRVTCCAQHVGTTFYVRLHGPLSDLIKFKID